LQDNFTRPVALGGALQEKDVSGLGHFAKIKLDAVECAPQTILFTITSKIQSHNSRFAKSYR
jgi:hypothetical protein